MTGGSPNQKYQDSLAELKVMIVQLYKSLEEKKAQDDERLREIRAYLNEIAARQNAWEDGSDVWTNSNKEKQLSGAESGSKQEMLEKGSASGTKQFTLVEPAAQKKVEENTAHIPHNIFQNEIEKLKAKVERMDSTDDASLSDVLNFGASAPIPSGFSMPTMEKFDGTGSPRAHLSTYSLEMKIQGATKEMAAQFFQLTLRGPALTWYLQQDPIDRTSWETIGKLFYRQYECNQEAEVNRRDLEALKQAPGESLSEYVARWRRKATQMTQRLPEEEQLRMIVKGLLPLLQQHLFAHYLPNFKALMAAGTQVEDAVNEGAVDIEELCEFEESEEEGSESSEEVSVSQQLYETPTWF